MSQPERPYPVPDPPSAPPPDSAQRVDDPAGGLAGLADRPVAEHVAVFEAEHDRLRRELSTIDQL